MEVARISGASRIDNIILKIIQASTTDWNKAQKQKVRVLCRNFTQEVPIFDREVFL